MGERGTAGVRGTVDTASRGVADGGGSGGAAGCCGGAGEFATEEERAGEVDSFASSGEADEADGDDVGKIGGCETAGAAVKTSGGTPPPWPGDAASALSRAALARREGDAEGGVAGSERGLE